MADIISKEKRGGEEVAQQSAKTDGMCKGGATGVGGAPALSSFTNSRGGKEYAQESAKTDGLSK